MDLKIFLEHAKNQEWWLNQSIVFFIMDADYPRLFFAQLFKQIMPLIGAVQSLDFHDTENAHAIRAACESSFLGQKSYYWCKHLGVLDAKRRGSWLDYCKNYRGPNCLLVGVSQAPAGIDKHIVQVPIAELTTSAEIQQMLAWSGIRDIKLRSFIAAEICKRTQKVPLDTVSLSAHYGVLAGADYSSVFPRVIDTVLLPEKSLFTLSGFLLARNAQQFFRAWAAVVHDYPEIFWIAYWSDVLWRAYYFASRMQAGNISEAKQIGNRLPFSFLQRDWKTADICRLKNAVAALYEIDRDLKNGAENSYAALELTFARLLKTNE